MTEVLKTNEFLRRRKLRLQQVREQSKDIAKKVRQRAKVEKLKHHLDCKSEKQKEYFQQQEKLVQRLEQIYAKRLESVGAAHLNALSENSINVSDKVDLSKKRGKDAAIALRKKNQEKLDDQKKLLERKIQAREAANEVSRQKSSVVANKLCSKPDSKSSDQENKTAPKNDDVDTNNKSDVNKIDMATQCNGEVPNEWEPNIPTLSIQNEDSGKDSAMKSNKSKRLDLFALSDEMPSSLRGGLTDIPREVQTVRPSLTLVSEYLHNRTLRLREPPVPSKPPEDLRSIKQTILQTRASKPDTAEGAPKSSTVEKSNYHGQEKKSFLSTAPDHRTRTMAEIISEENVVTKESPVREDMYSESIRKQYEMKRREIEQKERNKNQDTRHKIAMTKLNIEKEYKDTMTFLNSLPKEKHKPIANSYADERCQQIQSENRQKKLQEEFKKVERETRKHSCNSIRHKTPEHRSISKSPLRTNADSGMTSKDFQYSWMPVPESDENLAVHTVPTTCGRDGKSGNSVKFSEVDSYHEYRSRHKHTPPTKDTSEQPKKKIVETVIIDEIGNETTDTSSLPTDTSSLVDVNINSKVTTDKNKKVCEEMSDAERIVIYKILNSKKEKKNKKCHKFVHDIVKSLSSVDKEKLQRLLNEDNEDIKQISQEVKNAKEAKEASLKTVSVEQLEEGIYKAVNKNGDNLTSLYYSDAPQIVQEQHETKNVKTCLCNKKTEDSHVKDQTLLNDTASQSPLKKTSQTCRCSKNLISVTPSVQPSAATSNSSFKTATNDKANNAISNGGYIKFVDEGGKEAGKFYIGATGILKDDAYEMVIQLRKKDAKENTNEQEDKQALEKIEPPATKEQLKNKEITDEKHILKEQTKANEECSNESKTKVQTATESPKNVRDFSNNDIDNSRFVRTLEISDTVMTEKSVRNDNFSEKGVVTSFQEVSLKAARVTSEQGHPKASSSVYTQTALSSPIQRPVLQHLSSSTSTAYMSPPDVILPKFLKQEYNISLSEMNDSSFNSNWQDPRVLRHDKFSYESGKCRCKRCNSIKRVDSDGNSNGEKIKKSDKGKSSAPPCSPISYISVQEKEVGTHSRTESMHSGRHSNKRKCKCRKSGHIHSHKSKHSALNRKPYSTAMRICTSTASSYNHRNAKSTSSFKTPKTNLNPVVKKYINKLLVLKNEGLKAIDVMNQECSTVDTPGSSVIEVSQNVSGKNSNECNKISLEQIKEIIKQKISSLNIEKDVSLPEKVKGVVKQSHRKKTSVHKIKSLNISKVLTSKNVHDLPRLNLNIHTSSSSYNESNGNNESTKIHQLHTKDTQFQDKRRFVKSNRSKSLESDNTNPDKNIRIPTTKKPENKKECLHRNPALPSHKASNTTTGVSDIEIALHKRPPEFVNITQTSTQTNDVLADEIHYMQMAEHKLQNMEKIADLTEKCTQRLSNLAKVLDEVRRCKSVFNQVVSDTSDSDRPATEIKTPDIPSFVSEKQDKQTPSPSPTLDKGKEESSIPEFVPLLTGIPKPDSMCSLPKNGSNNENYELQQPVNTENANLRNRGKPPPALSRINLKNGEENPVPHELSTVLEVDSPLSVKLKNKSSQKSLSDSVAYNDNNLKIDKENSLSDTKRQNSNLHATIDLLQTNAAVLPDTKRTPIASTDEVKLEMMDLKQFNEIMLKPFMSLKEYAKQHNIHVVEEGSNLDEFPKENVNDELSSLHSDHSLPDVIGELMKRNVISEPFKFDTASNVNTTSASSESTTSALVLKKKQKEKKISLVRFHNKENITETSDTMSLSSNPDLENAFKNMGIGWASSTLRRTQEHLALSSSSNTSSSSVPQFKNRNVTKHASPALVTDTATSALSVPKRPKKAPNDTSKNAQQQTSLANSMTVKEFLNNELANKITFTNKSTRDETVEEFVSLYETKIPEEMKHSSHAPEGHSLDSANRARTSTPVQLYKSATYHSTSSSNVSNGLFSNIDLSSVKGTSNSMRNNSTSDKDDLTIPNCSLKLRKGLTDSSKTD